MVDQISIPHINKCSIANISIPIYVKSIHTAFFTANIASITGGKFKERALSSAGGRHFCCPVDAPFFSALFRVLI